MQSVVLDGNLLDKVDGILIDKYGNILDKVVVLDGNILDELRRRLLALMEPT